MLQDLVYIVDRRWVFPSTGLAQELKAAARIRLHQAGTSLLALFFPDNCRICETELRETWRYPVCAACMRRVEVFAPEFFCARCRTPFNNDAMLDETGVCLACRLQATQFDAAYCYGCYDGVLPRLIHLMKYGGVRTLARPLGELMMRAFPRDERLDALVPVPMAWWKRFRRGFNQTEALAREISEPTSLPVWNLLAASGGAPQAGLTAAQRRSNVAGRYRVRQPERVSGSRLMLIDDVFTTGATANACARLLKKAGARRVVVMTLARADRRRPGYPKFVVDPVVPERGVA